MRRGALAPLMLAAACAGGGEPWPPAVEGPLPEEELTDVELTIAGQLGAVELGDRSFTTSTALHVRGESYTLLSIHSDGELPYVGIYIYVVESDGVPLANIESCLSGEYGEPGVCYRAEGGGVTHDLTSGADGETLTLSAGWHDGSEISLIARYSQPAP